MNPFSPSARIYLSEVLGIKSYLCPQPIQALRAIKGAIPCPALAVYFKALSPSQNLLLEKIMASVVNSEFSLLEIKSDRILSLLLKNPPAPLICFFGGPSWLKEILLSDSLPASSLKKRGVEDINPDYVRASGKPSTFSFQKEAVKEPVSFIQTWNIEELEGHSVTALQRKKQLWGELKKWKRRTNKK